MKVRPAVVSLFPFSLVLVTTVPAQTPDVKRGQALYATHCVSCHGQTGEGDGPAATALKVRPADLTTISRRNRTFPMVKIVDYIDGEKYAVGHGSREMPVWGKQFRSKTPQGAGEVEALAKYLESIQK